MMLNKQNQDAGANSTQLQAENIIINTGIDEKRAREIYQEMNLQIKKDYTQEALEIANTRISQFEDKLLAKMETVSGALESFSDPSFQLLLVEAQKTAAATERPADYDLLSELLLQRFLKGENRMTRSGINRAVEIVDEIADDALLGLTVFHAVTSFSIQNGNIKEGLDDFNTLYGKLIYDKLPTGHDWIEHLDILDAVRIKPFQALKSIKQYYGENMFGYVCVGIEKGSEDHKTAIALLSKNRIPLTLLIDHDFNEGYLRLAISGLESINYLKLIQSVGLGNDQHKFVVALTEQQKATLRQVFDLYKKDQGIHNKVLDSFMNEWDKRENLKILAEWWDSISVNFTLTSIGTVLAHSNAQRCDKNLPPLN